MKGLREAFEYGLPRSVEVDDFKLTGSPLFDHLAKETMKGSLSIASASSELAKFHLIPGRKFSITATELILNAERFSGHRGVVFTNERNDGDLEISIRFFEENNSIKATGDIKLRSPSDDTPLKDRFNLAQLGSWAEQTIRQQGFFIEIAVNGMRLPLPLPSPETDKTWGFVQLSYTIGKPHRIARATDSSFILPENFSLSDKELKDIDLAYDLLKGERRKIQTGVFEFEPTIEIDIIDNQDLLCTTLLSINILDQLLCEIPACIELYGYQLEEVPDSKNLRLGMV